MEKLTVKVSSKNQVVIPSLARKKLGITPGKNLLIWIMDRTLVMMPEPENWSEFILGLGKEMWKEVGGADRYLKKERASWGY